MKLKIEILNTLSQIGDYLMPQRALQTELQISLSPPPTMAEVDLAVRQLEGDGYIIGVTNALTQQKRWKISDRGRAALAEAQG